ncbi:hypothetical protein Q5O14_10270 [Eubacteriaceae bacterium ES2]|nr:hypothetical protein Q5O14_10270 [Eubacteriaceae bacterium ES2]
MKKKQLITSIKNEIIFLFLLCSILILSGCVNQTGELVGNWELVPSSGDLNDTAMSGYCFHEDGTAFFYNGYDGELTISEGKWQIDGNDNKYLDLYLDTVDTPERRIRFEIADQTLYLFSDSGQVKSAYDSRYQKTSQFSFDSLITAAQIQKDKEKRDAQLYCTLSPQELIDQLKAAGLPIGIVVVYTDPDYTSGLLKQPNLQLAQGARFEDKAVEQSENQIEPIGGSVEIYQDYAVAKQRYDYLTVFSDIAGTAYQAGNVLLRLDKEVPQDRQTQYETALLEIVK